MPGALLAAWVVAASLGNAKRPFPSSFEAYSITLVWPGGELQKLMKQLKDGKRELFVVNDKRTDGHCAVT